MLSLEDKLRPPLVEHAWLRDLTGLAFLAVMAIVLIPSLGIEWGRAATTPPTETHEPGESSEPQPLNRDDDNAVADSILYDVTCPMLSAWLLPAMGFLLALRRGAIDLSVWLSMATGGLVSAWLIRFGTPTPTALGAGVLAGAVIGALNGLLVALGRLPSVAVTFVLALIGTWVLGTLVEEREVWIEQYAFDAWIIERFPLFITPMLLVAGIFSGGMFLLMSIEIARSRGVRAGRRLALFAAMCASGALSAAGGAIWLMEHGSAPLLTRPVGDLRIPAVAILAGALFFAGHGRTLLAAAALPVALLLTTIWRQKVWNYQVRGYAIQMLVLTIMAVCVHAAMARALTGNRRTARLLAIISAALVVLGLAISAHSANIPRDNSPLILGVAIWSAGTILLIVSRIIFRRVPTR